MNRFPQSIVVLRNDRLGDLLLSLPAIQHVRATFPDAKLGLTVRRGLFPVIEPLLSKWGVDSILFDDETDLPKILEARNSPKWDAALVLQSQIGAVQALRSIGVKVRVGRFHFSRSVFSFSHGVFQRRSRAEKSEGEYSLELARRLASVYGLRGQLETPPVEIPPTEREVQLAEGALRERGVNRPFVVMHPGMGGSALNASVEQYAEWIRQITGWFPGALIGLSVGPAPADREMAEKLQREFSTVPRFENLKLEVLREVFRMAVAVVAPSTGPLHLAHCVGTPTLGIFSPVRTHRASRWAPWGATGPSLVRTPDVKCPAKRHCLGEGCELYACMERIHLGDAERRFLMARLEAQGRTVR